MVTIEYVNQNCTDKSAEHLGCYVRKDCIPCEIAGNGESECDCRIEVGA